MALPVGVRYEPDATAAIAAMHAFTLLPVVGVIADAKDLGKRGRKRAQRTGSLAPVTATTGCGRRCMSIRMRFMQSLVALDWR